MTKLKSTKLTNNCREAILDQVIKDSFTGRHEALEERRLVLSEEVYLDVYDEQTRMKMAELPDGWLPMQDHMHVQFGSDGSGYCKRAFAEHKRFLAKHVEKYNQCLKVYDSKHELSTKHEKLTKDIEKVRDDRREATAQARAIIYSYSTTKQLKEYWPEITKYVEQYEPCAERTTAITPVTKGLNEILGLGE